MGINKYYQEELNYLRDMGKKFSLAYPKLAPYLSQPGQDPDVERLLEGFSFLTARIRQKLEDELPELTHELHDILWPDLLRQQPAFTIVKFRPLMHALSGMKIIPAGVALESIPVAGTRCRFLTCSDLVVYPIEVGAIQRETSGIGELLWIRLDTHDSEGNTQLPDRSIRFYIDGDNASSCTLYYYLLNFLEDAGIHMAPDPGSGAINLGSKSIVPAGFDAKDALIKDGRAAYPGHRLIREYYSLPQKFLFFDVCGLERWSNLTPARSYWLQLRFNRPLPKVVRVDNIALRLHCVPAVNVFPMNAEPLQLDHTKVEYPVYAASTKRSHYQVYSISEIHGFDYGGRQRYRFQQFLAEPWLGKLAEGDRNLFRMRFKPDVVGDAETAFITFSGPVCQLVQPVTVTMELMCTNGSLPQHLQVGDIAHATGSSPEFASFHNLLAPTPGMLPPRETNSHWQLIENLAANYTTNLSISALRNLLTSYNYRAHYNKQVAREHELKMKAMITLQVNTVTRLLRGLPVRGNRVHFNLSGQSYGSEGEMYLFYSVLQRFLTEISGLNSFTELVVEDLDKGGMYQWPMMPGSRNIG